MRIGARINLGTGLDSARGGLALLADKGWMMNLRQENEAYQGHPAGSGRPGLVAVTFGRLAPAGEPIMTLPVRWESVEPGDDFTILLDGDITLTDDKDEHAHRTLTLTGYCRMPAGLVATGDSEHSRILLIEAARAFITSVAATVVRTAGPGEDREIMGTAWSWLNGELPRARG